MTAVLAAARKAGVGIDYIETNSGWVIDIEQAVPVLDALRAAGVQTLLVSISPFHNAFIPFSRVKGVIEACRRSGMHVFPWVNAFVRDLSRLDERKTHSMDEFEAAFGPDYLQRIPDRCWIHLGGRALTTFGAVYARQPLEHILNNSPLSCARALSDTRHFHIDLYGNYIPGLCSGLAISMDDLGRPLISGKYPLIDQLAATGIRGLFALAVRTYGYTPQKSTFLNHCDLCTDIRSYLIRLNDPQFSDLAPDGFYAEYHSPE